ncbi:acyltransferase family protein [Hansschlegelia beijingensis]|uniref:acyltransferase family protein n=1 Tax=Hansschlegelia beijingensis TaxID=1133344 RepID=UPI00387F284C
MPATLAECFERKTNDLAAVRLLAATTVLYYHAWIVTTPGIKTADFFHIFGFSPDFQGVHAFFILSGMLLTRSLMRRQDPIRFIVSRLIRYLPPIFVAALFATIVVGPLVTTEPLRDYFSADLLRFILVVTTLYDVNATLPGVFMESPQPGILFVPLWTVHYQLVFEVALVAIWAVRLMRWRRLALAALALTAVVNLGWFWNGESYAYLGSLHHMVRFSTAFGIGVVLSLYADRVPVSNRILLVIAVLAAPLAYSHVAALAGMILIAYAILCIGFLGGRLTAALARLGAWSYGFYIWGYMIEQFVADAAPEWSAIQVFLVALPLSLAAGALSSKYVERPLGQFVSPLTAAIRRRLAIA